MSQGEGPIPAGRRRKFLGKKDSKLMGGMPSPRPRRERNKGHKQPSRKGRFRCGRENLVTEERKVTRRLSPNTRGGDPKKEGRRTPKKNRAKRVISPSSKKEKRGERYGLRTSVLTP